MSTDNTETPATGIIYAYRMDGLGKGQALATA